MQETSVKQSQFAHRRHWATAGKRAKRSQFLPRADTTDLEYATVCRR
jgi:hypothetical protein